MRTDGTGQADEVVMLGAESAARAQMVLTTTQVLRGEEPVRLVVHDTDGDWLFLCLTTEDLADGRRVALARLHSIDPSLGELEGLPVGSQAYRDDEGSPWEVEAIADQQEDAELGVLTSRQVMDQEEPVRIVIHDDEGDWMVLCGTTDDPEDALIVGAHHLVDLDPEIEPLFDMPLNTRAWRDEPGDPWIYESYT